MKEPADAWAISNERRRMECPNVGVHGFASLAARPHIPVLEPELKINFAAYEGKTPR